MAGLLAALLLCGGCALTQRRPLALSPGSDVPATGQPDRVADVPCAPEEPPPPIAEELLALYGAYLPDAIDAQTLRWLEEQTEEGGFLDALAACGASDPDALRGEDWWYAHTGMTLHVIADLSGGVQADNLHILAETSCARTVTLAFTGDVCLDDSWSNMVQYYRMGADIENNVSLSLLETLRGADITLINNEFCYSLRGSPTPAKYYTFRADPANVEIMLSLGADIVSLANNHCHDFGADAFADTLETLRNAGLPYVGAGADREEAERVQYYIAGGMKIAYIACTRAEKFILTPEAGEHSGGVFRTYDPARALEVISEAAGEADFVIVYPHWGTENTTVLEDVQLELARLYAEAGADLIVGGHPHCLQGIDFVGDCPVFYSLGNFWFNANPGTTAVLYAELSYVDGLSPRLIPCTQRAGVTADASGTPEGQAVLELLAGLSPNVSIAEDGKVLRK